MNTDHQLSTLNSQPSVDECLRRDAEALQRRQPHIRRANAEPLPGPLSQAFTLDELKQFGFTIRPVVASDFILLKRLDSPLYRQTFALAEHARQIKAQEIPPDAQPPVTKYDDEECVEMIYQFTRPLEEVRRVLKRGRDHFRETALATITDAIPIAQMDAYPRLVTTVIENFTAAFSTAVEYGASEKDGDETVFTTPPGANATASVGGGTTSPGSPVAIPPKSNTSPTNSR
jgi:hypothetical protein